MISAEMIPNWYVAMVHTNTELSTSKLLDSMKIENYVPTQMVMRISRSGRKTKAYRTVIPGIVFVRCTDGVRKGEVAHIPSVRRFMMDRASKEPHVAIVSEKEIDMLRFMVGQSEVPVNIVPYNFSAGSKVRIIRGALKGLEGEVNEIKSGTNELIIRLDVLGCACLSIDSSNLTRVEV